MQRTRQVGSVGSRRSRMAVAWACAIALGFDASAQPGASGPPPAATPGDAKPAAGSPAGQGTVPLSSLPPPLRLGARINLIERQFPVIPTVVIVPEEASYLAAIATWQTGEKAAVRFPVLIDDGTWIARLRIAQFIHAFEPRSIVRWKATGDAARFPESPEKIRDRVDATAAATWGAVSASQLGKKWDAMGFKPPGVVVCTPKDPAWAAGVALAAFHGEPILWIDPPQNPDVTLWMGIDQADAFSRELTRQLDAMGRPYAALGDDIDAVTLCFTSCSRVFMGPSDKRKFLSFTDLVGRHGEAKKRERWAWCGQIMGDGGSARAAYDAMCGLFLNPRKAWLFDGYDASQPWDEFDMTRAADALAKVKIDSILDDRASGMGLADLQRRAAGVREGSPGGGGGDAPGMGVDAGLVCVTTSGNQDFFDLKPGRALPPDVPIMRRPTMVYFVHSFSAASPTSIGTVAGVWRERGAYCYMGSVDEPYLQAFIPTPKAMARVAAGFPFAAAVHMDGGEVWKLTVLGDPLVTVGPQGPRTASPDVPLSGTEDATAKLPEQLKAQDFERAMWTLAYLGRTKDAARLVLALAKDKQDQLTPKVALAAMPSAFFCGDYQAFLIAAEKAGPALEDPAIATREGLAEARDMVWQAVGPDVSHPSPPEADALGYAIRPEWLSRDVPEAIKAMDATRGAAASRAIQERAARLKKQQ